MEVVDATHVRFHRTNRKVTYHIGMFRVAGALGSRGIELWEQWTPWRWTAVAQATFGRDLTFRVEGRGADVVEALVAQPTL